MIPPSYPYFFPYQKLSGTEKGSLTKFFATVGQKIQQNRDAPTPSYA